MDDEAMQEVAAVMAAVADGDEAAVFGLLDRFGDDVARSVRGVARSRGARLRTEEVESLVLDVLIELVPLARAWRPGVAPPWVWARHRVAALVDRHIGQWTRSLDELSEPVDEPMAREGTGWVVEDGASITVAVDRLADQNPTVALLYEGVKRVASPRDVAVWFDVMVEHAEGNRAPAAVVGRLHGLEAAAVRQQHRRINNRLRELAARESRFAALAELAVVA